MGNEQRNTRKEANRSNESTGDPEQFQQLSAIVLGVVLGIIGWATAGELVVGVAIFVLVAWMVPSVYETGWPVIYTESQSVLGWTIGAGIGVTVLFSVLYSIGISLQIDHRISALGAFILSWLFSLFIAPFAGKLGFR